MSMAPWEDDWEDDWAADGTRVPVDYTAAG